MIGNKIKEIRKSKRITQKELSRKTGISVSYIQQLEYQKKDNPSLDILILIANTLGVSINDITEDYNLTLHDTPSRNDYIENNNITFSEEQIKAQLANIIQDISRNFDTKELDDNSLKYFTEETYNFVEFLLYKHLK